MKLLATTTRYYLLLAAALFILGTGALYAGLVWALRSEMEEKLVTERNYLTPILQRTGRLPLPLGDQRTLSRRRPPGFDDTLEYDPVGRRWEPFRQLHFPVQVRGTTYWVTLRKSLLENDSPLGVVLSVMAAVLVGLLLSLAGLNRWLSGRLWQPFHQTLAALRGYELQGQPAALRLPAATPIDEFTELNQALTQMSARLAAEYQSLKEFTENAAHETQTPLAILQAKLERLLQLGARDVEMAPLLRDAYGATLRLSRLYQGLTLLSKIENGQFPNPALLRLADVVSEKLALLEELTSGKELVLTYEATDPVPVRMHPALADSLVVNLLQNAIKHNQVGGSIAVRLRPDTLEIRNTGPAPTGDPARYFERFQKQQPGSASPGLGPSVVQQVCRYYGFGVRYTYEVESGHHVLRVSTRPGNQPNNQ